MFCDDITQTDAFLDMPAGSQLLYFHLGMHADDDGFIGNPKMVMRMLGSSDDEIKILYAKRFLLLFLSGVCVVKHWRVNNQLRKDRYHETQYRDEKATLFLKKTGAYTLDPAKGIPMPMGHYIDSGNQVATTRQPSIGKVSIGKVSIDTSETFNRFWKLYPKKVSKKPALKAWGKLTMTPELENSIIAALTEHTKLDQWKKDKGRFIPHPSTWLNEERWKDEVESAAAPVPSKFDVIESKSL